MPVQVHKRLSFRYECEYFRRHIIGEKGVVCKHWLRGLCKKGDECEFLHEYDLTRMPECFFYAKYSAFVFFTACV